MEGEPRTKEILQEATMRSEQTTDAAKRSLMIVNDTKDLQAATLETLKAQGDQMKRIAGTLNDVEDNVDDAEVVLDSMQCCGCFGTSRSKAKAGARKVARRTKQQKDAANFSDRKTTENGDSKKEDKKKGVVIRGPRPGQPGSSEQGEHAEDYATIQEHRETQDNYLDQINDALDIIKEGAKEMGSEVEAQNKYMNELDKDTSKAQERVDVVQRHKVVRKHAKGLKMRK